MKNLITLLLLLSTIMFWSCKDEVEDYPLDLNNEYLPLEVGNYITYLIDSIIYDNFLDTTFVRSYKMKEEVNQLFVDEEGRSSARIFRTIVSENQDWAAGVPQAFYFAWDGQKVELVDDNLRFIKLVFPISANNSWEGNKFLDYDYINKLETDNRCLNIKYDETWDYAYENIGQSMDIGGFTFENTITVQQTEEENLIDRQYAQEIYAKGIGLVKRRVEDLSLITGSILPSLDEDPWPNRSNCGLIVTWELDTYFIQ